MLSVRKIDPVPMIGDRGVFVVVGKKEAIRGNIPSSHRILRLPD